MRERMRREPCKRLRHKGKSHCNTRSARNLRHHCACRAQLVDKYSEESAAATATAGGSPFLTEVAPDLELAEMHLMKEADAIAQRAGRAGSLVEALGVLRGMGLDDFGSLLLAPERCPGLSEWLPAMASEETQVRWTGSHGVTLLMQSLAFMRTVESLHARFRQRGLVGRTFLDYGCGWGRLLRLALYYSDPEKLNGVDAWDVSLGFCRDARVPGRLAQIDPAPQNLSVPRFDVAYLFSVFTHLPQAPLRAALTAMRGVAGPDAMLIFTFRPVEYWDQHQEFETTPQSELKALHESSGFAFQPVAGNELYGDTSMSHAFVEKVLRDTGWEKLAFDRALIDPVQEIVAAAPR